MGLKNENVLFRKEGHIGIVTLNRPEKLNAMNTPLIREFKEILDFIQEDDKIRVVIITGAGTAFSVGADIDILSNLGTPEAFRKDMKKLWHKTFDSIEEMEKLFIAALNGTTLGGAFELALACDLRLAAEGISLGLPQINFGLIPDAGGTIRLAKLVGPGKAKELILSGETVTSEEAREWGLINRVLSSHNFFKKVMQYASKFANKSPAAIGLGKLAVNKNLNQDMKSGLEDAIIIQSVLLKTSEYTESVKAYKKKPKSKS